MAGSANAETQILWPTLTVEPTYQEKYSQSLRSIRELGNFVVATAETESGKDILQRPEAVQSFTDFKTRLGEGLKTDVDFGRHLEINPTPTLYRRLNGQAVDSNGRPLIMTAEVGLRTSQKAALRDKKLESQPIRDANDVQFLERVNNLKVGEMIAAFSMDPKQALKAFPKTWQELGYRKGMAFMQWFCRVDEDNFMGGIHSFDHSDEAAMRELLAKKDVVVPADESPDNWLRYPIHGTLNVDQTRAMAHNLSREYYAMIGIDPNRVSIDDYLADNATIINEIYKMYYPELGKAVVTGVNSSELRLLASNLLQGNLSNFEPEIIRQIMRIANSRTFDDELGRTAESLLSYATMEELRKGLAAYIKRPVPYVKNVITNLTRALPEFEVMPARGAMLSRLLASNVQRGVQANRSFGGCTNSGFAKRNKKGDSDFDSVLNGDADPFGDNDESEEGACVYSTTGCYCCPYDESGNNLGYVMTVKVYADENGVAHCLRDGCGAWIDGNGNRDVGKIYQQAQNMQAKTTSKNSNDKFAMAA